MINKSRYFTVKNITYVHRTTKKIINSLYNEITDDTYATDIIIGLALATKKEGEEIIRYIDRKGNVVRV